MYTVHWTKASCSNYCSHAKQSVSYQVSIYSVIVQYSLFNMCISAFLLLELSLSNVFTLAQLLMVKRAGSHASPAHSLEMAGKDSQIVTDIRVEKRNLCQTKSLKINYVHFSASLTTMSVILLSLQYKHTECFTVSIEKQKMLKDKTTYTAWTSTTHKATGDRHINTTEMGVRGAWDGDHVKMA